MPTIIQTFNGRVSGLWGHASIRGADGKMHELQLGDLVHRGDVILTSQDGIVQLTLDDSATPAAVVKPVDNDLDRVISGLNAAEPQAPTAAGVAGGDGAGDLSPGLRVDRISESVTPAGFTTNASSENPQFDPRAAAAVAPEQTPPADQTPVTPIPPVTPIGAESTTINATEEGPPVNLGLVAPTGASSSAVITVTEIPLIGLLEKSDGTPVAIGTVLTTADLTGLKYVPPADYNGTSPVGEFTYKVTDGGTSATGTVDIHLGTVNDAPVANPDIAQAIEDTPLIGNVLTNDHDVDGNTLHVTQFEVGGVTHAAGTGATLAGVGTLQLNADGSYDFTPAANYNGPVPVVTYTITDGTATATSTLTINVAAVNDAPLAVDDIASTPVNVAAVVAVLANDHDPDGDKLTVTNATLADPTQGAVTINPDGTLTFVPANNYAGPVAITYTISDGHGGTDTATLNVTVGNNTPPTGADSAHTISEDTPYVVHASDFGFADADVGQTLANVRIDTLPTAGSLLLSGAPVAAGQVISAADVAAGDLVFVPVANGNGTPYASIGFSVQDSAGAFDTAPNTLTVNVTPVNDAPVAHADVGTGPEDTQLVGNVLTNDTDVDGDALRVSQFTVGGNTFAAGSAATLAGVGTLVIDADGSYTFTPVANYNGPVPVATYTATDGALTSTATLSLNVTPVNDAPVATDDLASTPINTPIAINVLANDTDVDGDPLTVTSAVLTDPTRGSVSINPDGTLAFTPATNVTGPVVVTYTVSDGHGGTDTATVTINVGANTPPTGADSAHTLPEDGTYVVATGDFGFADADAGQTLSNVRIDTLPTAGTLLLSGAPVVAGEVISAADVAAGHLVFVPAANGNGAPYANFSFSVQDSAGAFDAAPNTVTLNVTPVNDAPVAVADVASATEAGGVANGTAGVNPTGNVLTNDTDVDVGDTKAVSAVTGAAAGTVGGATAGAFGTLTLNADGSYSYAVNNGSAAVQALHTATDTLTDTFTYTVRDAAGATSSTTLTVTIHGANDAPVAVVDVASATEAGGVANGTAGVNPTGNVLTNDTDVDAGDSKAVSGVTGASAGVVGGATAGSFGTLTLNADGSYSYAVNNNSAAVQALHTATDTLTDTFTYTVRDAAGATSSTTLTVTIHGANDAPVAVVDTGAATQDVALTTTALTGVLANDTDVDAGDTKTVSGVAFGATAGTVGSALGGTFGTLTLNADGSYTYLANKPAAEALAAGQVATEQFTYTMHDASGAASTTTLTFTVTGTNDAPVAVADVASATEAGGVANDTAGVNPTGNVLTNDTDVDVGDTKAVSAVTGAAAGTVGGATAGAFGTLTLNADGSYSYAVNNNSAAVQALHTATDTLTDTFTYTVRDAAGSTSSTTLTVTIHGANDAPVAVVDIASATEAGGVANGTAGVNPTGNVLTNDTDVDAGDTKAVSGVTGASAGVVGGATAGSFGTLTLNADGSYSYAVNNGSAAVQALHTATDTLTDTFTYTVRDAAGATSSTTLTVTIHGANDAPVAVVDVANATEDVAVTTTALTGVLANDTDVDAGDTKTVSGVAFGATAGTVGSALGGTFGTLTLNADGSYTYLANKPAAEALAAGQVATEQFTYTMHDASGAASTTTLTFTVTGTNDAPVAVADLNTTAEDTPLITTAATGVLANDSDVDTGSHLTVTQFTVAGVTGTFAAGSAASITGVGTLLINADGSYNFTPALNFNGPVPVATYTVSDGSLTSSSTLTLNVTAVNDPPVNQVPTAQTVAEDTPLVFSAAGGNAITVSDVDSPSLTVTLSTANGALTLGSLVGVTITGNGTGTLTLTGSPTAINTALNGASFKGTGDYNGPAQVTVSTSDGTAPAVVSTIGLTITPVVDIHADAATTFESTSVVINVNANDTFSNAGHVVSAIDGHAIAVGGSVAVANGSVLLQADGQLLFTPTAGYNTGTAGAPTTFSYTVSSGGTTETANVSVTVTPVNNAAVPTLSVTPVSYWTFDETSGTSTVNKYTGQTGTLTDSTPSPLTPPAWVAGHSSTSGTALQFDGAGSYVALNAATTAPLMGTGSLSFWIKTTQTGSSDTTGWNSPAVIASEQNGGGNDIQWGALDSAGKIGFGIGNVNGVYSTTSVNDNVWHQVAITRDATTHLVNVYVDGHLESTGSPNDAAFTGALDKLIGFGATNNFANDATGTDQTDNNFLKASLDDIRIYNHVLTADQVSAIKSVESGYEDIAVANDGDATKLTLAANHYTALSVAGLNTGMVITDGTAGHTVTATDTGTAIDLTGWNLNSLSITGTGTGSATLVFNATDTVNGESHSSTQYLNIVNGTSLIAGGTGNDTLNGTANADLIVGNAGNDTLNGGAGNDRLMGGDGNDVINGGDGNDIIYGGAGNDILTGGNGADTFAWKLADRGTAGAPASDTITDFNPAAVSAGGDSIDLRDLLVGANHVGANPGNLQSYLDFDTTSTPGSTVIHISSTGGFSGGAYVPGAEDERITLQGVDIRSALSLGATASDNQIISELLTRNKLVTDGP